MAHYKQSMVQVSRIGMQDMRKLPESYGSALPYGVGRQAIDEHTQPFVSDGWQVAGYHVLLDAERNIEEHHFIWPKD